MNRPWDAKDPMARRFWLQVSFDQAYKVAVNLSGIGAKQELIVDSLFKEKLRAKNRWETWFMAFDTEQPPQKAMSFVVDGLPSGSQRENVDFIRAEFKPGPDGYCCDRFWNCDCEAQFNYWYLTNNEQRYEANRTWVLEEED